MIFRRSILNIAAILFIAGCMIYTIFNYKILSSGEGWGIVYMVGLCGLGLFLLLIDVVVQNIFKHKKMLVMLIGSIVLVSAAISLFLKR